MFPQFSPCLSPCKPPRLAHQLHPRHAQRPQKLMEKYRPTHMAVAFDTKAPAFRHKLSPFIKATAQKSAQWTCRANPLHSQDDTSDKHTAPRHWRRRSWRHHRHTRPPCLPRRSSWSSSPQATKICANWSIPASSWKQLWWQTLRHRRGQRKFGVEPRQIIDYLTLMGDASDGIKGVAGIGAKPRKNCLSNTTALTISLPMSTS